MAARSKNGTATNDASSQTINQRNAFAQGNITSLEGASRATMSSIFDFISRGSGDEIMTRAKEILSLNYGGDSSVGFTYSSHGADIGKNPDFPGGHSFLKYRYGDGVGNAKFRDINPANQAAHLTDMPNVFGPNLSTLSIDDKTPLNTNSVTSTTAKNSNSIVRTAAATESNGFGTELSINDPRHIDIDRSYNNLRPFFELRPTAGQRQVLGEYINTETYDYES